MTRRVAVIGAGSSGLACIKCCLDEGLEPWDVETENSEGKKEKHIFDAVMICVGHHCHPNLPLHDFPGIDTFTGKYFHSRDYKTPEEWRNKKVVVIGIGNSGGDIAVELSRVTKQLYLSTRRGAWILNRVGDNGVPLDLHFNRVLGFLRRNVPFGVFCSLGEKRLNSRFDHWVGRRPQHCRRTAAKCHKLGSNSQPSHQRRRRNLLRYRCM
uniref:Flavin-containing monooxygenase n=1 Tax=Acanthochromis polyacanthus TaxID=80966 RepID=A0A3Q1FKS2_9TELE